MRLALPAIFLIAICRIPSFAEDQNAPPNPAVAQSSPSADKTKDPQDPKSQEQQSGTSNDRLFFTLPNFLTLENAGQVPPLTTGQKYKVAVRSSFDPVMFPWDAALAGISQAKNSDPGYGQGAQGYGKRFGAAFADGTIENFFVGATLPSLLHQDPRYFQLGKGGFFRRTFYAVSRIVITRADAGGKEFNFSEVGGAAIAGGISNLYHPAGDRNLGNTVSTWGTQMGIDSISYIAKEFWPDIRRAIRKKRNPASVSDVPAQGLQ